ncbi:MAG: OmpA family protein [Marinagarivorans sp.]|nr:OmpA family protein [Marinagarivorans sp.]
MVDWIASTQGAVEIEGYTDKLPIHTEAFPDNWSLSSARVVAIASYLTAQGIEGKRMKAIGFGEYAPIADNATDEGRQLNRRVVIKVENLPVPAATANRFFKTPKAEPNTQAPMAPDNSLLVDKAITKSTDNTATKIPDNSQLLLERIKEKGLVPERLPSGALKFSHDPN